jgi:hypothetical protein
MLLFTGVSSFEKEKFFLSLLLLGDELPAVTIYL